MPRPKSKDSAKKLCSGCYYDRYNHPGLCERPGIDAPVISKYCWSLDLSKVLYCRPKKTWVMSCHTRAYDRWLAQYAQTGEAPLWRPY